MEGLSEPELYGDLVYRFKKVIGMNDFTFQFRKIITRDKRIGYNLSFMRQSTCLVSNPITVDNYAAYSYFNGTPVGRASDSMAHLGSTGVSLLLRTFSKLISIVGQLTESVSPRYFKFIMEFIMIYLFVLDDALLTY